MAVRAHVENAENAQEGRGPRMPDQRRITRKIMNGNPTTHVTLAYGNARHARGKKSGNARYAQKKKSSPSPTPFHHCHNSQPPLVAYGNARP